MEFPDIVFLVHDRFRYLNLYSHGPIKAALRFQHSTKTSLSRSWYFDDLPEMVNKKYPDLVEFENPMDILVSQCFVEVQVATHAVT